jgi:hypothetical protein
VAVRVLGHKAKINGYAAPTQIELGGRDGEQLISLEALRKVVTEGKAK